MFLGGMFLGLVVGTLLSFIIPYIIIKKRSNNESEDEE